MRSIGKSIGRALKPFLPEYSDYHMKDQYRIAVALKCYRHCYENSVKVLTPEMVEEFHQSIEDMEHSQVRRFVQGEINKQVITLFNDLFDEDAKSNPKLSNTISIDDESHERDVKDSERVRFTVDVKPSSIDGAEEGVFVDTPQTLIPGTVICLYPGLVHLKEYLKTPEYFRSILPDPNFLLMARTDQSLIDGRTANLVPHNPFAVAHKINHCGDLNRPNVMQASYDFPEDIIESYQFPKHLRKYIPNVYAKEPSMTGKLELFGCLMKSVVMVSCRPIKSGDELLMDYKLNPDAKDLPRWYRPYDINDARLRWGKKEEGLV